MKITAEILPASQICFHAEIAGEYSRAIYDRVVKDMVRHVRVPGFRPGKAPRQLVINHVGTESVKASVIEQLFEDIFRQIFDQAPEDREYLGKPRIEPTMDDVMDNFKIGSPLNVTMTMDFYPDVILGDYKNITVQAGKVEPDPDYVEDTLHQLRIKHATLVPVTDRPVIADDVIVLDSEVINLADNTIVDQLTDSEVQLTMDDDILEFELFSMILGMAIDEVKEQELTLPEEFPIEELQGEKVKVRHHVKEIKYRDPPPLDDDFARTISENKNLEEVREFLAQQAIKEANTETIKNQEEALIYALVQMTTVDIPKCLIDFQVNSFFQKTIDSLAKQLGVEPSRLQENLPPEYEEKFRESVLDEAIENVTRDLALQKLFQLENLQVPPGRYEEELSEVKEILRGKSIDQERLENVVRESLEQEVALEWLKANATIELVSEEDLKFLQEDSDLEENIQSQKSDLATALDKEKVEADLTSDSEPPEGEEDIDLSTEPNDQEATVTNSELPEEEDLVHNTES